MTILEKIKLDHPEDVYENGRPMCCPDHYGYSEKPWYCTDEKYGDVYKRCSDCFNRKYVVGDDIKTVGEAAMKASFAITNLEEAMADYKKIGLMIGDEVVEHPDTDTPKILDSGNRREFGTGAVRDIQEGKGRCDLMPLDVVAEYVQFARGEYDPMALTLHHISNFVNSGNIYHLYAALNEVVVWEEEPEDTRELRLFDGCSDMFLNVAIHFEEGAKKYGESNWQKGIPVRCYIDSALRHYFKFMRGDRDEPHDRAFCWNLMCAIWTCKHKPELNDYWVDNQEDTDAPKPSYNPVAKAYDILIKAYTNPDVVSAEETILDAIGYLGEALE